MKIHVCSGEQRIRLWFPTGLVFGSCTAWLAEVLGRKYAPEAMEHLPKGAVTALCREMRHLKRKYGSIPLVEVESAEGTQMVEIIL